MKALEIVNQVKDKKGQHVRVTWQRPAKVKKDCPLAIRKQTTAYVRSGIAYANLNAVIEGIEAGEREEVQSLKWGHWRPGFENYIIDHTPKGSTEAQEYIRLYPSVFENLKAQVQWFANGEPVEREQIECWLLASETRERDEAVLCFTVNAADIVDIG